ncbi:MAG: tetratricopeptide repeat protein [Spirosomataceae bacterium]
MKKLVCSLLIVGASAVGVYAQNDPMATAMRQALEKSKKDADAAIQNEKNAVKAKTWFTRGDAYVDVSLDNSGKPSLDSMASLVAYDSYKKAIELDTKEGKVGSVAKDAKAVLENTEGKGEKLYAGLMTQGAAKYQNKNFVDAYKLMNLATVVKTKDTTAVLYAGIVAQQMKNSDAAIENFEKFIALGGKDPGIFYALANEYRNKKMDEKAMATIDKAIEVNPTNKDLKAEKINMLLASGKSEEAIAGLKAMIAKDPNNIQNILNLGILYDNSAMSYSDEIGKLNDQLAQSNTSDLKKRIDGQKDKISAFEDETKRLNDKLKKDPKSAAATKKQIADITKMRDDEKAKLEQLNAELAKKSQSSVNTEEVNKKIADLTQKQTERKNLAKESYNKALQIDPTNYDALFNVGVMYFNEAVEVKKKVDAMDMTTYQKDGKAVEAQAVGKFKEAMPYFEKAWSIRKEADLKQNLTSLYNLLKQAEKTDAYDAKIKALE